MAKFLLDLLTFKTYFIFIQFLSYTSAVPCDVNSWVQLPETSIFGSSPVSVSNFATCQSNCSSRPNCVGIAWNSTGSLCYLNLNSSNSAINYNATNATTYYVLIRSLNTCNQNNYNCTFNWIGKKNLHGFGASQSNQSSVRDCVRACQENDSCTAVDWNYKDSTCWMFLGSPETADLVGITHLEKSCTNATATTAGTESTTKVTTPGPSTTSSTTITMQSASSLSSSSRSSLNSESTTSSSTTTTPQPTCYGQICNWNQQCNETSFLCTCYSVCSREYNPVCGNDLKTYNNLCEMKRITCQNKTAATMLYQGPCILPDAEMSEMSDDEWYPMAIKPAYIVLAGVGGGCLLLVLTAIIILCEYSLNKGDYANKNGTTSTVHAYQSKQDHESSYVESRDPEDMDMNEVSEMDSDTKPYGNSEEFQ